MNTQPSIFKQAQLWMHGLLLVGVAVLLLGPFDSDVLASGLTSFGGFWLATILGLRVLSRSPRLMSPLAIMMGYCTVAFYISTLYYVTFPDESSYYYSLHRDFRTSLVEAFGIFVAHYAGVVATLAAAELLWPRSAKQGRTYPLSEGAFWLIVLLTGSLVLLRIVTITVFGLGVPGKTSESAPALVGGALVILGSFGPYMLAGLLAYQSAFDHSSLKRMMTLCVLGAAAATELYISKRSGVVFMLAVLVFALVELRHRGYLRRMSKVQLLGIGGLAVMLFMFFQDVLDYRRASDSGERAVEALEQMEFGNHEDSNTAALLSRFTGIEAFARIHVEFGGRAADLGRDESVTRYYTERVLGIPSGNVSASMTSFGWAYMQYGYPFSIVASALTCALWFVGYRLWDRESHEGVRLGADASFMLLFAAFIMGAEPSLVFKRIVIVVVLRVILEAIAGQRWARVPATVSPRLTSGAGNPQ